MAVNLKVTPEKLQSIARAMDDEIQAVKNSFNDIDKIVYATNRYWQGDASDKHIGNYEEIKPEVDNVVNKLTGIPNNLLEIAGLYVEVEETNNSLAVALPDDVFA